MIFMYLSFSLSLRLMCGIVFRYLAFNIPLITATFSLTTIAPVKLSFLPRR
jgi:hypothetical protein